MNDAIPGWIRRGAKYGLLVGFLAVLTVSAYGLWSINQQVRSAFGEENWADPSRVYARAPELYPGKPYSTETFESQLKERMYVRSRTPDQSGEYRKDGQTFLVHLRGFEHFDEPEPRRRVEFVFGEGRVRSVRAVNPDGERNPGSVRLEPIEIGTFHPTRYQDWVPVRYEEIPTLLRETLVMVEDRRFYDHFGLDPIGILRALVENIQQGRIVQGGSTLTQQLVKNRFLGNQQTLWRKAREAVYALVTEWHYDKETILQAYVNEVYVGQLGRASIHGFGKASQYFFGTTVEELTPNQMAMIVGLIKGPSTYDPRDHPDRAVDRRNLILEQMREEDLIEPNEFERYAGRSLNLAPRDAISLSPYPDFVDLVKRRLEEEYSSEELRAGGLRVFTTLIPETQRAIQSGVSEVLPGLETDQGIEEGTLETGVVIVRAQTGEITGLIGSRDPGTPGFNRAVSLHRPVGSVIKPAVYLTALKNPESYSLLTRLEDEPLEYSAEGDTTVWSPGNFDGEFHGEIPLLQGLVNSRNAATARLGIELGSTSVHQTLVQLGIDREELHEYPSLYLGAVDLSLMDVAQMYQTLANQGYRAPLKAVLGVTTRSGERLEQRDQELERTVDPVPAHLIDTALTRTVSHGTGQALDRYLSGTTVAGKTGTTQGFRDSWFAGYSRNRTMVAWIGRDDYSPTGLTGATGALRLWGDLGRRLDVQSIRARQPEGVETMLVDRESWLPSEGNCEEEIELPVVPGSGPEERAPCAESGGLLNWFGAR